MFRCNDEEKRESGRGKYAASNQTIVLLTKPTSCAVVPASLHLRPISLHICEHNLDLPFIVIELKKCYKWVVAKKMHINSCKTLSISPFSFKTDTQTKTNANKFFNTSSNIPRSQFINRAYGLFTQKRKTSEILTTGQRGPPIAKS